MTVPYTRAPHQGGAGIAGAESPHAALLIDFDNVTMGMRSDLSKELKSLLASDVIKGKVSVQRAYADWRRYPQYIVPLSEASVDLIFAPAYGSNKKNATDIRMAIDALELIFIRPEIGTYILLTGDSDFSSLVLKLKEYGKYVIGVGIQESSSDILVQNCDEYYSYTSLTGLTKTTEVGRNGRDPWVLVKDAVAKMVQRGDVMRSDRLKQVMQELDPAFDEGSIGFSKFSKFLAEAASRGLVKLQKMDNGQYEVEAPKGGRGGGRSRDEGRGRRDRGRGGRRGGRDRGARADEAAETPTAEVEAAGEEVAAAEAGADPLSRAYDTLTEALTVLREAGRDPVRDSDVKRKMLELNRSFDETELGFPKFSKFLQQSVDHGIVRVDRTEAGNLEVSLIEGGEGAREVERPEPEEVPSAPAEEVPEAAAAEDREPTVIEVEPPKRGLFGLRLGPRRGTTRRRGGEAGPSLFGFGGGSDEAAPSTEAAAEPRAGRAEEAAPAEGAAQPEGPEDTRGGSDAGAPTAEAAGAAVEFDQLGLPSDPGAIVRYLTHRYKGVGEKTAEALVEKFGPQIFRTMHEDPDAIARAVPPKRAEQVLEAWRADFERRTSRS
jgi:uncharacterized protein (TIGR00288 family)